MLSGFYMCAFSGQQFEGAVNEGNKGDSIWDKFTRHPGLFSVWHVWHTILAYFSSPYYILSNP